MGGRSPLSVLAFAYAAVICQAEGLSPDDVLCALPRVQNLRRTAVFGHFTRRAAGTGGGGRAYGPLCPHVVTWYRRAASRVLRSRGSSAPRNRLHARQFPAILDGVDSASRQWQLCGAEASAVGGKVLTDEGSSEQMSGPSPGGRRSLCHRGALYKSVGRQSPAHSRKRRGGIRTAGGHAAGNGQERRTSKNCRPPGSDVGERQPD